MTRRDECLPDLYHRQCVAAYGDLWGFGSLPEDALADLQRQLDEPGQYSVMLHWGCEWHDPCANEGCSWCEEAGWRWGPGPRMPTLLRQREIRVTGITIHDPSACCDPDNGDLP